MQSKFIYLILVIITLQSCNDEAVFEKEMYKNIAALISSDYYNIFEEEVPLDDNEEYFTAYIAACTGGTHAPKKDMIIEIEEDSAYLNYYNKSLFDVDEACYAKFLSKDKYEIENYKIVIKAGERTGKTMIKINPEGLSPDSTYFIGIKASDLSEVELNDKKNTLLYKVLIKNQFANQAKNNYYSMTGLINGKTTAGNIKMFPLTGNRVRINAGILSYESNVEHIDNTSIILEVDENNNVSIMPYKNIEVQQLDGDAKYPNIFKIEEIYGHRYNVFLLSYKYIYKGVEYVVQEELRIEI